LFSPIPLDEFIDRTRVPREELDRGFSAASVVVSLRDLKEVLSIQMMTNTYLMQLLRSVTLAGDPSCRLYEGCSVKFIRTDAGNLKVGQTFVQKTKVLASLLDFFEKFHEFSITGYAKLKAFIALGTTKESDLGIAHYVPPIIESFPTGTVLMDGLHRCFAARGVGTTIETVKIYRPKASFPCTPNAWESVRMVDEKPPKEERFFDLKPELFRDLKGVGIDG